MTTSARRVRTRPSCQVENVSKPTDRFVILKRPLRSRRPAGGCPTCRACPSHRPSRRHRAPSVRSVVEEVGGADGDDDEAGSGSRRAPCDDGDESGGTGHEDAHGHRFHNHGDDDNAGMPFISRLQNDLQFWGVVSASFLISGRGAGWKGKWQGGRFSKSSFFSLICPLTFLPPFQSFFTTRDGLAACASQGRGLGVVLSPRNSHTALAKKSPTCSNS